MARPFAAPAALPADHRRGACRPSARGRGSAGRAVERLSAWQNVRPFGADAGVEFLARARDDRKGVAPRPRLAGIDDDARVARIVAAIGHGVEHRAPAAAQDFDAFARVEARAHRPHHLVHVGGIDVVIDHDHDPVGIGAGVALRGNQPGLLGVTGVLLLDRDSEPEPAAAGRMRPHAFDFGHAGGFELVPHRAGAIRAAVEGIVVGRHGRDRAEQNRVVAVHEGLDADRRLLFLAAGVIARPFAERPLLDQVVGMHEALERDLRLRRDGQAGARPRDHLDRLAYQAAGDVVFIFSVWNLESRHHEQGGVHAHDHRDRARLAALVIAALDQVAVLALGAHDRRRARAVGLHAIGAVVDPAGVGILHDHHAAGADIVAAVVLVPPRRRDALDVDVLAAADVFHERPGFDRDRRDAARLLHVFAPIGDELERGTVDGQTEREVDAPHRGENVREDAVAVGIAGNVVEQHGAVAHLAHVEVDDAADFRLALGAADLLHLARRAQRIDPAAQVLLRRLWRALGGALGGLGDGLHLTLLAVRLDGV